MRSILLSIAGYDPTGGAGLLLDIRVFNSLGWEGMGIATAVTAQNTSRVFDVFPLSLSSLARQYDALKEDVSVAGIKTGMLGSRKHLAAVGRILEESTNRPVVVDPVLGSSSGFPLFEASGLKDYLPFLKGRAAVITPNIPEAELLLGRAIGSRSAMEEAAVDLHARTGSACLLKGGHLPGRKVDILFDGERTHRYPHPSLKKKVHGTGCFLSAALLAGLASGLPLDAAAKSAVEGTQAAIRSAAAVGGGQHLFSWQDFTSGRSPRQK